MGYVSRQHRDPLERRDVDQHPARDERADVLDAELGEARARRHVADLDAVVQAVADRLMREPVELRADLADLGEDDLFVAAAAVRPGIHVRALRFHLEAPADRERHVGPEHAPELEDLAGAYQARGPQHRFGLHVIAGAALVGGAPFRRTALGVGRRLPRLRARLRCERIRGECSDQRSGVIASLNSSNLAICQSYQCARLVRSSSPSRSASRRR